MYEISSERLKFFDNAMTDQVVCLLHSPPGSGKTILAHRLKEYLSKDPHKTVIYISMLKIGNTTEKGSGDQPNQPGGQPGQLGDQPGDQPGQPGGQPGSQQIDIDVFNNYWIKYANKS